ncbi:MAG: TetR/AcrR family transcriptional regulator [Burkholderiaceae bacterium]
MYERQPRDGFGSQARPKPLKRPAQARAKFTVQAIYDAFVRIWQRDGWTGVTTRAVALEAGVSVGTLYEYFPNKQALLSGYVRHGIEALITAMCERPLTLGRIVRLVCDPRAQGLPPFDARMLDLEHEIAEPKHHRRAYDELLAAWCDAVTAAGHNADAALVESLFIAAWGGRRYLLRVQPPLQAEAWIVQMQHICAAALAPTSTTRA